MNDVEWIKTVSTLAQTLGFGGLVWYLVVRHIPAIELRNKEERESERKEFLETIDGYRELINASDEARSARETEQREFMTAILRESHQALKTYESAIAKLTRSDGK